MPTDVVVVGAGAAGLSAAIELARLGFRIEIIEARDRVGGRIFGQVDPELKRAIELGAEFVHGRPDEIWLPLGERGIPLIELAGDPWYSRGGRLSVSGPWAEAGKILDALDDREPDESFAEFLARRFQGAQYAEAREWATGYVSGFNAADPRLVSVHWLAHNRKAEEMIDGERGFRVAGGYQRLVDVWKRELESRGVALHLNAMVREIAWRAGASEIRAQTADGERTFGAARALITLPLGVLQDPEQVAFRPQLPEQNQAALDRLVMGKVVRVTLCFKERFWQDLRPEGAGKSLAGMSFLFSRDAFFPTWWTLMPEPLPVVTGWAAAECAERLSGLSREQIVEQAQESLATLLGLRPSLVRAKLRKAYFHDWTRDRFSLGAYSYVKAGGEGGQQALALPVAETLFFAGEATDTGGHNGTVHGAIASAMRAAKEALRSLPAPIR